MNMVGNFEARLIALEQEQSVLGALMRNNNAVDAIGDLKAEHFYDITHRAVFQAIIQLLMANKPADVITVYSAMQAAGGTGADLAYLNAMAQSTPSAANIRRYVEIVRDRSVKRGLVDLAHQVIDEVRQSADDAGQLVSEFAHRLEKIGQVSNGASAPQLAADGLSAHVAMIDELHSGGESPAIATGMTDIDLALNGGPRRGNLVVLAARPKMGKTALALNIANHVAVKGVSAVFSMEMTKPELHNRNLASIGRIPLGNLNDPKLMRQEDWAHLTSAISKLGDMRLYLDDQPGLTMAQIAAKSRQVKRKAGALDLIVIDYLQLMNGPGDSRNAQIEAITRGLKNLAKELDCVIMLLSQLNRKLEDRPNKRPQPADLRDSGSIEQDCDIAVFLYRDEVYNPDSQDKGTCEANIALNRHGPASMVRLVYIGENVRFEDVARGWHPAAPRTPPPAPRRGFE